MYWFCHNSVIPCIRGAQSSLQNESLSILYNKQHYTTVKSMNYFYTQAQCRMTYFPTSCSEDNLVFFQSLFPCCFPLTEVCVPFPQPPFPGCCLLSLVLASQLWFHPFLILMQHRRSQLSSWQQWLVWTRDRTCAIDKCLMPCLINWLTSLQIKNKALNHKHQYRCKKGGEYSNNTSYTQTEYSGE